MRDRHNPIRIATVASVVLIVVCIVASCQGGGSADAPKEVRFTDFDAFVASDAGRSASPRKVVFVGIDGASWNFIDPLIDNGELPAFKRIKREGAHGTLRSVECYVSPPAWCTMFTGYLPGKTGVYTFAKWNPADQEFMSMTSSDVMVPSIWDVASHAGRRVAVINVPMTYPVHPLNGLMISGMMTPIDAGQPLKADPAFRQYARNVPFIHIAQMTSYSKILDVTAGDSLNAIAFSLYDTVDDGARRYDTVSMAVYALDWHGQQHRKLGSNVMPIEVFSPWQRILTRRDGDIVEAWCKIKVRESDGGYTLEVSQPFFDIEGPYAYPVEVKDALHDRFGYYLPTKLVKDLVVTLAEDAAAAASYLYDYDDWDFYSYVFTQSDNVHHLVGFRQRAVAVYKIIDRFLGELMERLPRDAVLVIGSDHGFGEYEYGIDLNMLLGHLGLLEWASPGKIDYDNTVVFHNLWHLYFNSDLLTREELGKRGIKVPPNADPAAFFAAHLTRLTKDIRSDDGSLRFPLEFTPVSKQSVGSSPDMLVRGTYEGYIVDFWNLKAPKKAILRENEGSDRWWHIREGMFAVWGKGVRRGYDTGVKDIQDIAPTILYMLDLPIADDMDGRLMKDVFEPRELGRNKIYLVADYSSLPVDSLPDVERQDIEKKLRSLGYIR
jgi:predicted AlkP superfamily phosphohydrolase/phosphomutase